VSVILVISLFLQSAALPSATEAPAKNFHDEPLLDQEQLLNHISDSFSKIPLNTQLKNLEMPLAEINHSNCYRLDPCWVENSDGVRHIFIGEEKMLSKKWIRNLRSLRFSDEAINALNLGQARTKVEVVKKISLFLSEDKYECLKVSDWQGYFATIYPEESLCTWKVQSGEVSAKFLDLDSDGILLDELAFTRNTK
jgi:hypothetical protein